jgi:hypothetical protein
MAAPKRIAPNLPSQVLSYLTNLFTYNSNWCVQLKIRAVRISKLRPTAV